MNRARFNRAVLAVWLGALFVAAPMMAADPAATGPATKPALSKTIGAYRSLQIQWDSQSGFRPDIGALTDAL